MFGLELVGDVATLVSAVIKALEDVKVNKQTCKLLAEQWRRLQEQTLPKLQTASEPSVGKRVKLHSLTQKPELNGVEGEVSEFNESKGRWEVKLHPDGRVLSFQASNLAVNLGQSHHSALQELDLLGKDTQEFIAKFNDRGFINKHWNHASDKEKFRELGKRLDILIQELQLGILTDIKVDLSAFLQKLDRYHDLDFEDVKKQLDHIGGEVHETNLSVKELLLHARTNEQLLHALTNLGGNVEIKNPKAAEFWKNCFMNSKIVPWNLFAAALCDTLEGSFSFDKDDLDCIRRYFDFDGGGDGYIDALEFNVRSVTL